MAILKTELIEQIENSKAKIDESKVPNFIQEMFRITEKAVMENATTQDKDNEDRKEEVMKDFRNAWDYSQRHYPGDFDLVYLTEVAGRVEPNFKAPMQTYAEYRSSTAILKNMCNAPADKERIMTHLNRMIRGNERAEFHPVEEAIYLYFHLMRIQPFDKGNKRTANIVMNTILRDNGFLPITITPSEKETFSDYFEGALEGFREAGSEGNIDGTEPYIRPDFFQQQFYEFLGRKELHSLQSAENEMEGLPQYLLELPAGHPGGYYTLKHNIDRYFKSRGLPGQVRLNESKRTLSIIGELPMRTLESIVAKSPLSNKKVKISNS